jgi:hypothetical protein
VECTAEHFVFRPIAISEKPEEGARDVGLRRAVEHAGGYVRGWREEGLRRVRGGHRVVGDLEEGGELSGFEVRTKSGQPIGVDEQGEMDLQNKGAAECRTVENELVCEDLMEQEIAQAIHRRCRKLDRALKNSMLNSLECYTDAVGRRLRTKVVQGRIE